jgi:hypothetical protein
MKNTREEYCGAILLVGIPPKKVGWTLWGKKDLRNLLGNKIITGDRSQRFAKKPTLCQEIKLEIVLCQEIG